VGQVIRQGQVLYTTDLTDPVVLLYGSVPDWRALGVGVTGADVTQLNHDLVNLGDADSADISALGWDYFSWETKAAVSGITDRHVVPDKPGKRHLSLVVTCRETARSPASSAPRRSLRPSELERFAGKQPTCSVENCWVNRRSTKIHWKNTPGTYSSARERTSRFRSHSRTAPSRILPQQSWRWPITS
jgi:hypothetical protein